MRGLPRRAAMSRRSGFGAARASHGKLHHGFTVSRMPFDEPPLIANVGGHCIEGKTLAETSCDLCNSRNSRHSRPFSSPDTPPVSPSLR